MNCTCQAAAGRYASHLPTCPAYGTAPFFIVYQRGSGVMHLSTEHVADTGPFGPEVNPLCGARLMNHVTTLPEPFAPYTRCTGCMSEAVVAIRSARAEV